MALTEVILLARSHTQTAINVLIDVMNQRSAPAKDRVTAAEILLARGYGKIIDRRIFRLVEDKYYVYSIHNEVGKLIYIGKGSGNRCMESARNFNGRPRIRRRFSDELAALDFERRLIKRFKPKGNITHARPKFNFMNSKTWNNYK